MTFKIGDKVTLTTDNPAYGIGSRAILSEVGTIVEKGSIYPWIVDFPSHKGFYATTSDLAPATVSYLKAPPHSKTVKLRIVKGIPPDSSMGKDSAPAIQPPDTAEKTDEIIRQWKLDKSLRLETLAADFYTLIDLQCDHPKEPKINKPLEKLTTRLADQFSAYLDMVIGGELRHAGDETYFDEVDEAGYSERAIYHSIDDMPLSVAAKEILRAFRHKPLGNQGRNEVWAEWQAIREAQGIKALKSAKEIFHLDWEEGYGGESWARATKILIDYLDGGLSDIAFVDTCFGLHHNNNIILDKVWKVGIDLKGVLDYNLKNRMSEVAEYCSPKVEKLVRRFR